MSQILHFFKDFFFFKSPVRAITDDALEFDGARVPIRNGIVRFTPDQSYSTGNFAQLREKHATLQLDSINGTKDRREDFFRQTGWSAQLLNGKTVLECGCGAGPDTEILASLGAKIMSVDLAGGDVAKRNLAGVGNVCFVQASIMDLPLKEKSFDIVFCHRVLQHTPDPAACMRHMARFVKPGGHFFVDTYADTWVQKWHWKYWMLPFTKKMDPEKLYHTLERCAPFLYGLTSFLLRLPFGKYVVYFFIPFRNYRFNPKYAGQTDAFFIEYGIHDTFDNLSPPYDIPLSAREMRRIGNETLDRPFEIEEWRTITMLRTIEDARQKDAA
jgi:ubiquinone/menaquinone biosynthesis C-methylase UbiE